VEALRETRARGRLVVAAVAAVTMLAAPFALLHGDAAQTAPTAEGHRAAAAAGAPAPRTLGATQLLSANAPTARSRPVEPAGDRPAVGHADAVRAADRRHASAVARAVRAHHAAVVAAAETRHSAAVAAAEARHSAAVAAAETRHSAAVAAAEARHSAAVAAAAARHRAAIAAALRRIAGHSATGIATWYAWHPGQCASPFLPHGTLLTVTDLATHKTIQCLVTDTEAHNPGRVVDLSSTCFEQLAPLSQGVILVRITW